MSLVPSSSSAKPASSASNNNGTDRHWQDRELTLEEVKKKLREGWRNDPAVLQQYFESCVNNWKVYRGERTPKQVLKLQSIYKQAVYGDNKEPPPQRMDSAEGEKWRAWTALRGTPQEMAKRRFITFLSEMDPLLVDVMPDEKPPVGFPLDRRGIPICAKCNTVVGCNRPITDQYKIDLQHQLLDNEEFQEPERLQEWIRNALQNQRCVWGLHKPITKAESREFTDWFNRSENRGFYPYDSLPLMKIVRELVHGMHEVVYDLMQHKDSISAEVYNETAIKTAKVKEIFESFSGEKFVFELPCTRDAENCNQRRAADHGKNHMHEIELDPPTKTDTNTMEEAIALRLQCQQLGINPSTGVVKSIKERCEIYRQRIADHFEAQKRADEAKVKNELRPTLHKEEKKKVFALSKDMLQRQCWDACNNNLVDSVLTIVRRGANANEENAKGLTPLLTLVINEVPSEQVERLITYKADLNFVNKYGFTPLMMACRQKDAKMVHVLMRSGASALQKGYKGRNALHVCTTHGSDEIIRIIVDYLKESAGDAMRVARFIDAVDDDGETAMVLASYTRNGSICYQLTQLGANPNLRNRFGRSAAYIARNRSWTELADWLEKKVGAGASKVQTYSDMQFEKQARIGDIKIKELLQKFGRLYLTMIQNRVSQHPLGCPFNARYLVEYNGEIARKEQQEFVDNHQRYIFQRYPEQYTIHAPHHADKMKKKTRSAPRMLPLLSHEAVEDMMKEMNTLLREMLALVTAGFTYPDTEIGAQPLPWTPLMCAIAVNDMRSVKLLLREGASANHPNKDGTTPVMLATQLQHVEVLVELLQAGGDLRAIDSQGYSVLAYAGSLPVPTVMSRDLVGVLLEDDVSGPRLLHSTQAVQIALQKNGLERLKEVLATNREVTALNQLENHKKILALLEQFGLTPVNSDFALIQQVQTSQWRVSVQPKNNQQDDASEETSVVPSIATQETTEEESESDRKEEILRCPICTLPVPCQHFFKKDALLNFLKKRQREEEERAKGKTMHTKKKIKLKNRAQEVLAELHIDDRNTDRSATFARVYQQRETQLEKEKQRAENANNDDEEDDGSDEDEQPEELMSETLDSYFQRQKPPTVSPPRAENSPMSHSESLSDFPPRPSSMDSVATESDKSPTESASFFPDNDAPTPLTKSVSSSALVTIEEDAPLTDGLSNNNEPSVMELLSPLPDTRSFTPVSILKPPSRASDSSRQTKRVKFSFPDDDGGNNNAMEDTPTEDQSSGADQDDAKAEKDALSAAMDVLKEGGVESKEDEKREKEERDKLMEIAAPRRLLMFTKDRLGTQDDGFTSPSKLVPPKIPKRAPKTPKKTEVVREKRKNKKPIQEVVASKVEISGWLFAHLAALQSHVLPLENVSLSQSAWIVILDHIQRKFNDEWLQSIDIQLLIDVKTWESVAPRCSLCAIGFVRNKNSLALYREDKEVYASRAREAFVSLSRHESPSETAINSDGVMAQEGIEPFLCLQCLVRKELFQKMKQSLPRSFRKSLTMRWPFAVIDEKVTLPLLPIDESQQLQQQQGQQFDLVRVLSPPRSPLLPQTHGMIPLGLESSDTVSAKSPAKADFENTFHSPTGAVMTLDQLSSLNSSLENSFQSPIASLKLKHFDFHDEALSQRITFEDDELSIPSLSALSLGSSHGSSTASLESALTIVDPLKKPREMTLLPYLISKGHFEDAERTVRLVLGKQAVDEGEGLNLLLKILTVQSDMYKMMGLWPLALAIALDVADLTARLLGLRDSLTMKALSLVVSCMRKMQQPQLADDYMKLCIEKLGSNLKKSLKDNMIQQLQKLNSDTLQKFLNINRIWVDFIFPEVKKRSSHKLSSQFYEYLGLAGFYSFLTDQRGSSVVSRRAFFSYCAQYCNDEEEKDLGAYTQFVDLVFRMRTCDDDEIYRFLVQRVLQKLLAKSLVPVFDIARKFREITAAEKVAAVVDFLHNGTALDVTVFDDLLLFSLQKLHPLFQFFMVHSAWGEVFRESSEHVISTSVNIAATMIQCLFRRNHAKLAAAKIKEEKIGKKRK